MTEIVVRLWRKSIVAHRSEDVTLHIAVLVDAVGDVIDGQIRDLGERFLQFFIYFPLLCLESCDRGFALSDLRPEFLDLTFILCLHGLMDFIGSHLAACSPTLKDSVNRESTAFNRVQSLGLAR